MPHGETDRTVVQNLPVHVARNTIVHRLMQIELCRTFSPCSCTHAAKCHLLCIHRGCPVTHAVAQAAELQRIPAAGPAPPAFHVQPTMAFPPRYIPRVRRHIAQQ